MDMNAISPANVTLMSVVAAACILGPIIAAIIAAFRFRCGPAPIVIGILIYLLSQLLVRTPLLNLFYMIPGVENFLSAHGIFQDFVFALTTAVIEELARWAAFFLVLKKRVNDYSAITYGIGHGGTEIAMHYGFLYILNFTYAQSINLSLEQPLDGELMDILEGVYPSLAALTVRDMLLTIVIAASTVCLHVMYTFIIARGVRYGTTKICLPLSMGMHFLFVFLLALVGRLPDGIFWQAIFSSVLAVLCVYYLLEARRRAVMADYEKRRNG